MSDFEMHQDKGYIIRNRLASVQVCCPKSWSDEQVVAFATKESPPPPLSKWEIRREGNVMLFGDPERAQCAERSDCCHIVLDW